MSGYIRPSPSARKNREGAKSADKCGMQSDDIMKDVREIDPRQLQSLTTLYRADSFIRAAAEKRQTVTLNGGVAARIGGIIDLPYFDERTGERLTENLKRAIEWRDVAGFIPFSVDTPDRCDETSGASIGFGSDEAERLAGGQSGLERNQEAYRQADIGTIEDEDEMEEEQKPLRPPLSSVEPSDFDFVVPSLGIGRYRVYRDVRDNKRRMFYVDEDEGSRKARVPPAPHEDIAERETESEEPKEPVWYVYVVEEPDFDGSINSPVARLRESYVYLKSIEKLEYEGAKMGYRPVAITQHTTPGRGLRNLDNHVQFTTDVDAIEIGKKDNQGMPVGFRDALLKNEERTREILEYHGIDPDKGMADPFVGGTAELPKMNIESRRQLAGIAKPTKIFDVSEKEKHYIARVAVEFGVPVSDLSEVNTRFKVERGKQSVSLIEKGRIARRHLTDILYHVFDIRNANRARKNFVLAAAKQNAYLQDLRSIIKETQKLIDKARKDAVNPEMNPKKVKEKEEEEEAAAAAAETKTEAPSRGTSDEKKQGGGGGGGSSNPTQASQEQGLSTGGAEGADQSDPASESEISAIPKTVEELVDWVRQVEISYSHIERVQSILNTMLDRERPIVITWKQPLIADTDQIETTAALLHYDEAQKASLARYHHGLES